MIDDVEQLFGLNDDQIVRCRVENHFWMLCLFSSTQKAFELYDDCFSIFIFDLNLLISFLSRASVSEASSPLNDAQKLFDCLNL